MFTRRRSRAFLLDTVNRGAEFVEVLKIVYPKASDLHENDFDWLFDCPEAEHFLEWFCNTVREENVLSPTEVEAYENLLISGKPVLEEEVLKQVLKTCHQSSQLRGAIQDNETVPIETLEKVIQMSKSQYACQLKRCNKLQIHAASMKQESCHLAEKSEKASRELKKTQLQLELENFQSNDVFSKVCKTAKELVQRHREPGNERMKASVAMMDLRHYLDLEEKFTEDFLGFFPKAFQRIINYVEAKKAILAKKGWGGSRKEMSTENIAKSAQKVLLENKGVTCSEDHKITIGVLKGQAFYWKHLAGKDVPELAHTIVPEEMEHPETEEYCTEALDIHDGSQRGLKTQAEAVQAENCEDSNLGRFQEEWGRMELTYLCSQRLLVMTSAEIEGTSSALQWARKALKAAKENKAASLMTMRGASSPPSSFSNVNGSPGGLSLGSGTKRKLSRKHPTPQQNLGAKQTEEEEDELHSCIAACQEQLYVLQNEVDQATGQQLVPLLQGNARLLRLPVIHRELDLEAIRLRPVESMQEKAAAQLIRQLSHLEVLRLLLMLEEKNLHQMNTEIMTLMNESEAKLQKWQSCFESSTFSIKQCPQTLIDPNDLATLRVWRMLDKHGQEKELLHTYETLAGRGSRLCQELKILQVQLVKPLSQLPKLESDHEILYCMMYDDSNQLMLHAQELSESLEQLGTTQAKLYEMLMDTLSDLKVKRKALQSHTEAERNLYVLFFSNPTQLEKLVEQLEENAHS